MISRFPGGSWTEGFPRCPDFFQDAATGIKLIILTNNRIPILFPALRRSTQWGLLEPLDPGNSHKTFIPCYELPAPRFPFGTSTFPFEDFREACSSCSRKIVRQWKKDLVRKLLGYLLKPKKVLPDMILNKWFPISFCASISLLSLGCSKKPRPVVEPEAPIVQPMVQSDHSNPDLSDDSNRKRRIIERAIEIFKPIYFAYDQVSLNDDSKRTLTNIIEFTKEYPEISITIEGHCDERGTDDYNLALGERRAQTVSGYLKNLGNPSKRTKTISYGEERPAKEGREEQSWKFNRRVEFKIEI
ncbi:MAG: OmpA family protein [Fibrobacteria bacterium]